MSLPSSESTLPLPGADHQFIQSSPPPYISSYPAMPETRSEPAPKLEPADQVTQSTATKAPTQPIDLSDDNRPPSAQQAQQPPEVDPPAQNDDQDLSMEEDIDPAEEIEAFDWDALHERYHDAMTNASAQETALMQDFAQLMNYFKIWADAGANQESDRTFHRLRTRMTYTQHSEDRLEKTRQHYNDVVRAFESALALLRNTGFGG